MKTLEKRIEDLEARFEATNVTSPKFIKRAFAILGHELVAVCIIYGVLIVALFFFAMMSFIS